MSLAVVSKRRLDDSGIVVGGVLTAVSFNAELLGVASIEGFIRPALQAALICFAFLAVAWTPQSMTGLARPTRWLLAFLVFAVTSTLWTVDPMRTLSQSLAGIAVAVLVATHSWTHGTDRTRRVLARTFLAVLVVSGCLELLGSAAGARWAGVAGSPTQLAQLAVLTASLALVGRLADRESFIFTAAAVAISGGLILASQSRVAFAVVVVLVAVTWWLRNDRSARTPMAISAIASTVTLAVITAPVLTALALRDSNEVGELSQLTGRTTIWPRSLELIADRLLFGHGFASGEVIWAEEVLLGSVNWNPTNAHHIVLEALLSLGLLGLALLSLSMVTAISDAQKYKVAAAMLVLPVAVLGLTESMVHYTSPSIIVLATASTMSLASPAKVSPAPKVRTP